MDQDFTKLHKEWMQRLKSHGFKDIEYSDGTIKDSGRKSLKIQDIQSTQDFFLLLDHLITNWPEMPEKEKQCLSMYSSGITRKNISIQLKISQRSVDYKITHYSNLIKAIAKIIR
jgi:hypothetical protein